MRLRRCARRVCRRRHQVHDPAVPGSGANPDIANGDYDIHWLEKFLAAKAGKVAGSAQSTEGKAEPCAHGSHFTGSRLTCCCAPMLPVCFRWRIRPMTRTLFWVEPELRGVLPLDGFHVPQAASANKVRHSHLRDPGQHGLRPGGRLLCAESVENRPSTWINSTIAELYGKPAPAWPCPFCRGMAGRRRACWRTLRRLAAGVSFFGESMFSRATDASKVCLVHLVEKLLRTRGFVLLDTQFTTEHLQRFGVIDMPREDYASDAGQCARRPRPAVSLTARPTGPWQSVGKCLSGGTIRSQEHGVVHRMHPDRAPECARSVEEAAVGEHWTSAPMEPPGAPKR
jgi:leucyl/phenylalanyl-tRNA--protein transferase